MQFVMYWHTYPRDTQKIRVLVGSMARMIILQVSELHVGHPNMVFTARGKSFLTTLLTVRPGYLISLIRFS